MTANMLLPTTVVGSYPQPRWLVDHEVLNQTVPRIRIPELWRVAEPYLEEAQDDATRLAIRDMEQAGIDIITDGEIRRESYSNALATAFEGIGTIEPASIIGRLGRPVSVPRVIGRIRRTHPVALRDARFLRANTDRMIKVTLPGPFTMARQMKNEFYRDEEELVMDLATAVNEEILDLAAAGVDVVQLDEPWMQAFPDAATSYGVKAVDAALHSVTISTAVHVCFGYSQFVQQKAGMGYVGIERFADSIVEQISVESAQARLDLDFLSPIAHKKIILGVIDLGTREVETSEEVAGRIRAALAHVRPDRLIAAPDCGMKYLGREVAFGKLKALSEGAGIMRRELAG